MRIGRQTKASLNRYFRIQSSQYYMLRRGKRGDSVKEKYEIFTFGSSLRTIGSSEVCCECGQV
jgi:hypothetical protein